MQYSNSSMLTPLNALHLSSHPLQTTSNIYTSISLLCLSLVVSFYIFPSLSRSDTHHAFLIQARSPFFPRWFIETAPDSEAVHRGETN